MIKCSYYLFYRFKSCFCKNKNSNARALLWLLLDFWAQLSCTDIFGTSTVFVNVIFGCNSISNNPLQRTGTFAIYIYNNKENKVSVH
jgi:hypothetical protein